MLGPSLHEARFDVLLDFLARVPAVQVNDNPSRGFGTGFANGIWWVKFSIDVKDTLAWHAVQEFGFVLNSLSLGERLPTTFKPESPPPYLNGGPADFLSWVIECPIAATTPTQVADTLQRRLPQPVAVRESWNSEE